MKKISIYLLSSISVFIIAGCGGSSSPLDSSSNVGHNTRMEKGVPYEVKKGDKIEKLSENPEPELKIDANLSSGKTTVTLINGEASIISK